MYIDCAFCWIYSRECCPVLNLNLTLSAGFGAGTPQQEHFKNAEALQKCSPGRAQHFQELKICGHGTILALTVRIIRLALTVRIIRLAFVVIL